jgi:ferrous iron transport protein B
MSDCHTTTVSPDKLIVREKTPLIALAGQPNVGKSTLFNLLTGLNQHVGNWPGKTVERREGNFILDDRTYGLVDLPGTYSLTANSPEEVIAREFILREQPDVVVAVVNAASLERSLYLVAELIALPSPLVVALNMMDVAAQEGIHVEADVLEAALGVPVVPITATRAAGTRDLFHVVRETLDGQRPATPRLPEIRSDHRQVLAEISQHIAGHVPAPYPEAWIALKLLEGDAEITRIIQTALPTSNWEKVHSILRQHDDALLAIASGRY